MRLIKQIEEKKANNNIEVILREKINKIGLTKTMSEKEVGGAKMCEEKRL